MLMLFSRDNVKVTQRTMKVSLTLCCVGDSAAVHRADQREADESGMLSRAKRSRLEGDVTEGKCFVMLFPVTVS